MTSTPLARFWRKHRAVLLTALVLFGGYQVGKDRALRDNARDANVAERPR